MLRAHLEHPMGMVHDLASLKGSLQTLWEAINHCLGLKKRPQFLSVNAQGAHRQL